LYGASTFGMQISNPVGGFGDAVTTNFPEDLCATRLRVFKVLKNQSACALAQDKAVALCVKRPAGSSRVVVASRQSTQQSKSREMKRRDHGIRAARHDKVSFSKYDPLVGLADRLSRR